MNNERLSAYLDGELTDDERRQLEIELGAEPQLAAELEATASIRTMLRDLPMVEPTRGIFERPIAQQSNVVDLGSERNRRRTKWAATAAGVASMAAVWMLILGVFSGTSLTRVLPAVDQYVDRHAAAQEIADGFEIMEPMPKTDMPADAAEDGTMPMTAAFHKDDVVHLRYGDGDHSLSVYSEPGEADWDALGERGGEMDTMANEPAWHYVTTDGIDVVVIERDDHVITMVAAPEMHEAMETMASDL